MSRLHDSDDMGVWLGALQLAGPKASPTQPDTASLVTRWPSRCLSGLGVGSWPLTRPCARLRGVAS